MAWNKEDFSVLASYQPFSGVTRVVIRDSAGNTTLQRDLKGDQMDQPDESKIELVFELVATEIDPAGAIAKAKEELAETQDLLKETREELKRSTDSSDLNRQLTMSNSSDIDELFGRVMAIEKVLALDVESEEEDDENSNETGQESPSGSPKEDDGNDDGGDDHGEN